MTVATLTDQLGDLLAENFGVPREELRPDTTFSELEFDSLVLIEFGLLVRKRLGVVLTEEELTEVRTIADAAALVAAKESPAAEGIAR